MGRSHAKALKYWKSKKDLHSRYGILTSTRVIFPKLALLSASARAKDTQQSVVVSLMALLKLPDETSIVQSPSVVTVLKGLHVV